MQPVRRLVKSALVAVPCLILVAAAPADASVASALIRERDPLPGAGPGHVVTSLSNTAVNHVGGYAINLNSSDGVTTLSHIWGNPSGGAGAIMRTEGTFGGLVQTSFESFYGMADDGSVAYSALGTGGPVGSFDSVWRDDTLIMVEGAAYPHAPSTWWRFGSRPGISANGIPYFVGGITFTQGGSTQNRGLFLGMDATPLFVGGDVLPGLPLPLGTGTTVSFDYRFSENASFYLAEIQLTGSTTADAAMVINGQGLVLAGTLVREGNVVPVAVGGNGVEKWSNFDYCGITEAGWWFFSGDTDAATSSDEFIVKNGVMIHREGNILDGENLNGSIESAYMNANGDLAFVWPIRTGTTEALYVNDRLVLMEGDPVDLDGDGFVEPTSILTNFTGISALTLSDRDVTGRVNVYFKADVDTAGTSSTTDDREGFFCLPVDVAPTLVQLSGLTATPALRGQGVVVSWTTSLEENHAGFHVYRADAPNASYDRLNDALITGRSPYSWTDASAPGGRTLWYIVGAVDHAGIEVRYGPVEVTTPGRAFVTRLGPGEPNPFTGRTRIEFSLERESRASLTILDVTGRRIATLVDATLPAGEHGLSWDGRTDDGRTAAAGVYFTRLESESFTATRKLVRLGRD